MRTGKQRVGIRKGTYGRLPLKKQIMNPFLSLLAWTCLAALPAASDNGPVHPPATERTKWVVLQASNLSITGHAGNKHFTCSVPQYAEPDTLSFLPEGSRGTIPGIPLNGTVRLNIDDFDCHNRAMTGEFKTTVLAPRFPQLRIIFVNLEQMPAFTTRPETIKGWVEIELAGTCRMFEITYTSRRAGSRNARFDGSRTLAFHDFALASPSKMGHLLNISDTLDVRFTLYLQQIE